MLTRLLTLLTILGGLGGLGLVLLDDLTGLPGEEARFEDFEDNEARLAFLQTHGFLPGQGCGPTVESLDYRAFQDALITFELKGGTDCAGDAESVLGADLKPDAWHACRREELPDGVWRYICSNG